MTNQQDILQLLTRGGVELSAQQITLMRHKDERYPLVKYIGTRALNLYQAMQEYAMPVGSLLVGCFGNRPGHAVLLGVWRVHALMPAGDAVRQGVLNGSFEPLHENWPGYFHELHETNLLKEHCLKLEIEWGHEVSWRRVIRPSKLAGPRRYAVTAQFDSAIPFPGLPELRS